MIAGALAALFLALGSIMGWESKKLPVLRIGISPWPGYEFIFLAQEKGFFAEEGLNIELKQFSSPEKDIRRAFERGQLEGMCNAVPDLLRAYDNSGRKAQIVLATDYSAGADVILAKDPAASMSDLKGKKIGVETMSLGLIMLSEALRMEGLALKDVSLADYGQDKMAEALRNGDIAAAVTYPPASSDMLKAGGVKVIFDSARIPGKIIDILAIDERILRKHPEIAPAMRRAWGKALRYAEKSRDEAYALMARRERVEVGEFIQSFEGLHIVTEQEQMTALSDGGPVENAVAATLQTLAELESLRRPPPAPADFIFRP